MAKPISAGNEQMIRFLVRTHFPSKKPGMKFGSTIVPCILLEASEAHREMLMGKEWDRFHIELLGRVVRSVYENAEGEELHLTEVLVNPRGLLLKRVK
ncbi:hypothetical protein [Cerasicoccus maritimus]|uniref:hypothetical protein n=1 Tax=Cerasicoccus maritimus TaxID=490089 RepID=UPI002852B4A8|nr:hypothetical protein [Cerasicoccus maritimus]